MQKHMLITKGKTSTVCNGNEPKLTFPVDHKKSDSHLMYLMSWYIFCVINICTLYPLIP